MSTATPARSFKASGGREVVQRPLRFPGDAITGVPALLARVLASRLASPREYTHALSDLPEYGLLPGIRDAASRIADAVVQSQPICVFGDYDADGATATALSVLALRAMRARCIHFFVPHRIEMGYGLTPPAVSGLLERYPDTRLIVTVDTGVASISGVSAARERGIDVVVTDHHLPGDALPDAAAIVDPCLCGSRFESRAVSGVGVAFYVMAAVREELRVRGWFNGDDPPLLAEFLDLVALGTVADVVPLDRVNRILVEQGLRRIRSGLARPGIAALLEVSGKSPDTVVSADLGFSIGPRLNAAGRLASMATGIECLLSESIETARPLARALDRINRERREIESRMLRDANTMLDEWITTNLQEPDLPAGICVYSENWHEGVVGLVAGRIKETGHRPVVAFAPGADGALKGSARSIPGVHIRDILASLDAENPGLILRFGGHAMAAGLTIQPESLPAFTQAFANAIERNANPGVFSPVIETDGELSPDEITLENAEILRYAGPWGQAFQEPLFHGVFDIQEARPVGNGGNHVRLRLRPATHPSGRSPASLAVHDGIFFDGADAIGTGGRRRLLYKLDVNYYRGRNRLQLMVVSCLD